MAISKLSSVNLPARCRLTFALSAVLPKVSREAPTVANSTKTGSRLLTERVRALAGEIQLGGDSRQMTLESKGTINSQTTMNSACLSE